MLLPIVYRRLIVHHFILWGLVLCRLSTAIATAATPESDRLPDKCATEPIFKEFEDKQEAAYLADTDLDFRNLLDPEVVQRVLNATVAELRARSKDHGGRMPGPPAADRNLQKEVGRLRTPTCYENPLFYYRIRQYVRDIDSARRELGRQLSTLPRFGTLPSNDINAYTYPSSDGKDTVIALNVRLFDFIDQMTTLAVSAIDPSIRSEESTEAKVITQALLAISYNQHAKQTFVSSLTGLLLGRPLPRLETTPSDEPFVVFFTGATLRFVVAHEYGHLLNSDLSAKQKIPTGATGIIENDVLARTWQQELRADALGLQLLSRVLLGSSTQSPEYSEYYICALKAPLLFLEALDIKEQAFFMLENGEPPKEMADSDRALIRNCLDGPPSVWLGASCTPIRACAEGSALESEQSWCKDRLLSETHPPAWLRYERLESALEGIVARIPRTTETEAALRKADEILFSLRLFWKTTSPQVLMELTEH